MIILIAEDDPTIRANLLRTLRLEGFEAVAAANGQEALDLAREQVPALVLSDVMMPELDGLGLLAALRSDPRTCDVPFVFLTARADRSDVREGMNLGADDYLTKPFARDELVALVRAQIARAATRHEELSRLRQETQRLRLVDPVTELPNRHGFETRLTGAVAAAERHGSQLAVISLGLEGLGAVRQTAGGQVADQVLRVLADRLFGAAVTAGDESLRLEYARAGDSAFNVLVQDLPDETVVEAGGEEYFLFPSAGIALFPADGSAAEDLLHHALAAEPAPVVGGSVAFYSAENKERAGRRVRILNALPNALERGEISVWYQPQLSLDGGSVVGFEALLRWHHHELDPCSPAEFIPIAEDSGLIVPIGAWAMEESARQMKTWLDQGLGTMRIAVNLSSRQFEDDDLPARVAQVLAATGLPPEALELEITESIAMQSAESVLRTLVDLKALGVALAMDDFGTGYSSLAYLKRYPLDALKIDQVFVRNLIDDPADRAITRAVIALARSFNLAVVAEGVETPAHAAALAEMGCQIGQGWHYGKPMSAEGATGWLQARAGAVSA